MCWVCVQDNSINILFSFFQMYCLWHGENKWVPLKSRSIEGNKAFPLPCFILMGISTLVAYLARCFLFWWAQILPHGFWKFAIKWSGSGQKEVKKKIKPAKVQTDKIRCISQWETPLNGKRLPGIKKRFNMWHYFM